MKITIAIPTYNRATELGISLESISRIEIPSEAESIKVVVIGNNCTDSSEADVYERSSVFPFALRYVNEPNQGLCFGRNRAIEEASDCDYLVLLDDDISIHPKWLVGLVYAVNEFRADAIVGPVYARFIGDIPSFLTEKARRSLSSLYSLKGNKPAVLGSKVAHEIPGCNFAVKVRSAAMVGGFDSKLDRVGKGLLAGGDFDFGHRLVRAGLVVAYHPECAIDHLISSEKLNERYLLRRWRGIGATVRTMVERTEINRPRFFSIRSLCVWFIKSSWYRVFGTSQQAFDASLEWEKLRGFFWRTHK